MYLFENIDLDLVMSLGDRATRADIWATLPLAATLLWLSVVDLRDHRLPDLATLPLVAAGIALATWRTGGLPTASIAGAAVGYAVFALLGAAFYRRRGVEGLGLGDAKLLAASGAWLGFAALPFVVLASAVAGLVFAMARRGSGRAEEMAFGPFLSAAFFGLWVIGVW